MESSRVAARRSLVFLTDLIGKPRVLMEIIEGLSTGTLKSAPTFLLDHMPKAYAIWMWNDYDANK